MAASNWLLRGFGGLPVGAGVALDCLLHLMALLLGLLLGKQPTAELLPDEGELVAQVLGVGVSVGNH